MSEDPAAIQRVRWRTSPDHGYGVAELAPEGPLSGPVYVVSVAGPQVYVPEYHIYVDRMASNTQFFHTVAVDSRTFEFGGCGRHISNPKSRMSVHGFTIRLSNKARQDRPGGAVLSVGDETLCYRMGTNLYPLPSGTTFPTPG